MPLYSSSKYSSIKSWLIVLFRAVILHLGISKDILQAAHYSELLTPLCLQATQRYELRRSDDPDARIRLVEYEDVRRFDESSTMLLSIIYQKRTGLC